MEKLTKVGWYQSSEEDGVRRAALLDHSKEHRYVLTRIWTEKDNGYPNGLMRWVMLNPSTADGLEDDPTIRRCIGFARDYGYDGIVVTNLYSRRTKSPAVLKGLAQEFGPMHPELLGEHQHYVVRANMSQAMTIPEDNLYAGWGGIDQIFRPAVQAVTSMAQKTGCPMLCLGRTQDEQPRHPLYLKKDTKHEMYFQPLPGL